MTLPPKTLSNKPQNPVSLQRENSSPVTPALAKEPPKETTPLPTQLPHVPEKKPVNTAPNQSPTVSASKTEVEKTIRAIAAEIGLKQVDLAIAIGKCESGLNPAAVGDSGRSRGIWQIYAPAHPTITAAQAHDVEWSTRWALGRMKQGSWGLWTCYRKVV